MMINGDSEDRLEMRRIYRLTDQQISAHNALAKRANTNNVIINLIAFATSIILAAATFADKGVILFFFHKTEDANVLIGTASLILFFMSSLNLFFGWSEKYSAHEATAKQLFELKQLCREELNGNILREDISELIKRRYELILSNAPNISDSVFLRLKAKHIRKIELSKYIDKNPFSFIFMIKIRFWISQNFGNKNEP